MLSYPEYLAHLDADAHLLGAAAALGLEADVPCCPGWKVADLVDHITRVYVGKADIVAQGLADRWPSSHPHVEGMDPVGRYRAGASRLSEVLAAADPAAPAKTFSREQTVGFWIRRMAHETLVHRIDAEQAHGYESQVDPELAKDGIAEIVEVFITRFPDDWGEFVPGQTVVRVGTDDQSWTLRLGRFVGTRRGDVVDLQKAVVEHDADSIATISGDPGRVLLWMWGRAPLEDVTVDGDLAAARLLREVCSI